MDSVFQGLVTKRTRAVLACWKSFAVFDTFIRYNRRVKCWQRFRRGNATSDLVDSHEAISIRFVYYKAQKNNYAQWERNNVPQFELEFLKKEKKYQSK